MATTTDDMIPTAEVLNIVLAAGKKPRHAQKLVINAYHNGEIVLLPMTRLGSGSLTIAQVFDEWFRKYKIDVDKLLDDPTLTWDTKQMLFRLTQQGNSHS